MCVADRVGAGYREGPGTHLVSTCLEGATFCADNRSCSRSFIRTLLVLGFYTGVTLALTQP